MHQNIFDQLSATLSKDGPLAAIDQLCTLLTQRKDYANLFYALLVKKRHELGVSPIPSGASSDLPPESHQPYEDGIREAARAVGRLFLAEGNIPHAWAYYRMIGEPEEVKRSLENATLEPDADIQPLIDIAYYQGVHPRRGFDWILDRYGTCNAITTVSSSEVNLPEDMRDYCIRRLVRALYDELQARLRAAVENRLNVPPAETNVAGLLEKYSWLCEDEFPHIDTSHLSAVVQMAIYLPNCDELQPARELADYGRRLPKQFQQTGDTPFDDFYGAHGIYLAALAGEQPERAVDYFRQKISSDTERDGTRPAQVLVNLLLRLQRPAEALEVARKHLVAESGQHLACPSILDLCQRTKDYGTLADISRQRDDPVHFLAALLRAEATVTPNREEPSSPR